MEDISEKYAIESIVQQCNAFTAKGARSYYKINSDKSLNRMVVSISIPDNRKIYHFSDPDLNVIIGQLCTLQEMFNKKKDVFSILVENIRLLNANGHKD